MPGEGQGTGRGVHAGDSCGVGFLGSPMPVEDALGAPGLLARLASRWSLGGDAAGPVLLRVRCLVTTHVTTRGLSRCLTLHSLCSVETRRVPRTAMSRGQRAPGQFGSIGISESHWLHAKAPVDPCEAPGPAQTEWHRPAGSSLARAGAQPGPTHTRPQQPAGTVPVRRARPSLPRSDDSTSQLPKPRHTNSHVSRYPLCLCA